jgi:NAD(P)-dependent dehydrogenase (short-subunit alcohol dehydrogenase family)
MQSRLRRNAMTEAVALTLVTGATRGIGRAIADHLSALGHRVVGLSRIFRYFRSKSSLGRSIDEDDWRRGTGQRSSVCNH